MGIDETKLDEVIESFRKSEDEQRPKRREEEKTWKILAKYFVHGATFSLLFAILAVAWILGFLLLVNVGSFIGLLIGFGILMVIVGGLNSVLNSVLWFQVKSSFWSVLGHGFVLFIVLIIVNGITVAIPTSVFPGTSTTAITFIIASFIDGFVAKRVAGLWKQEYPESVPEVTEAEWRDRNL